MLKNILDGKESVDNKRTVLVDRVGEVVFLEWLDVDNKTSAVYGLLQRVQIHSGNDDPTVTIVYPESWRHCGPPFSGWVTQMRITQIGEVYIEGD